MYRFFFKRLFIGNLNEIAKKRNLHTENFHEKMTVIRPPVLPLGISGDQVSNQIIFSSDLELNRVFFYFIFILSCINILYSLIVIF